MNVEIRKLTLGLLSDFLDFFDNVAFKDHAEWSDCYCTYFHWDSELKAQHTLTETHKCGRDYAIEFIKNGIIQGYLAYLDGEVVGWCNANDRTNYRRLKERVELWDDNGQAEKVKAVVCFIIAPNMRGKGIATQLLNRVYTDAVAERYAYVEAYPHKGEKGVYLNYYGPYIMYIKSGFTLHKEFENDVVVRKYC